MLLILSLLLLLILFGSLTLIVSYDSAAAAALHPIADLTEIDCWTVENGSGAAVVAAFHLQLAEWHHKFLVMVVVAAARIPAYNTPGSVCFDSREPFVACCPDASAGCAAAVGFVAAEVAEVAAAFEACCSYLSVHTFFSSESSESAGTGHHCDCDCHRCYSYCTRSRGCSDPAAVEASCTEGAFGTGGGGGDGVDGGQSPDAAS